MLVVLDSTVLIDFLRGRPAVQRVHDLKLSGDVPATTAINVEEIVRGLRVGEEQVTSRLFAGLEILPVNAACAWQAGVWRREHAERGVKLWQADCLIAATSYAHGGRLVTGNPKDFPMPGVVVERWPVGE